MGIEVLRIVNIVIYFYLPSRGAAEHFAQTLPHVVIQVVGNEWTQRGSLWSYLYRNWSRAVTSGTSLLVLTEQQIFYINH